MVRYAGSGAGGVQGQGTSNHCIFIHYYDKTWRTLYDGVMDNDIVIMIRD